jgi:putative ABC transport system permease protein
VISIESAGVSGVLLQGWEPGTSVFNHLKLLEGQTLTTASTKEILLGSVLAKNLGKGLNDTVELIQNEKFKVAGIYETTNVFENGAVIMPLKELQRIMDRPRQVTGFSVIVEGVGDKAGLVQKVRTQIESLMPTITALPTQEHVNTLTEIQAAKAMAWMTSAIALLIGLFGMTNTMMMSVNERTKEIGILRAVGWRARRVMQLILLEATFISLTGAFLGVLGAFALVKLLTRLPTVNGVVEGRIPPILIVQAFILALGIGLIGGYIPARRAARMRPTRALHHD